MFTTLGVFRGRRKHPSLFLLTEKKKTPLGTGEPAKWQRLEETARDGPEITETKGEPETLVRLDFFSL
jgi:hypothetical protein